MDFPRGALEICVLDLATLQDFHLTQVDNGAHKFIKELFKTEFGASWDENSPYILMSSTRNSKFFHWTLLDLALFSTNNESQDK